MASAPALIPFLCRTFTAFVVATFMTATAAPADQADFRALFERAEKGEPSAQLSLAIRYRDGGGVEKDPAAAMLWAHRAADQGHPEALDFVGFAYLRGAMVKRNTPLALAYFQAAAGESAQAAFNLGQCYYGAQGTEQDCAKGLEWW